MLKIMNTSKMGHNGKKLTSEKFYEKDPFLTPAALSNNNSTGMTCCDEKHKLQCTGTLLYQIVYYDIARVDTTFWFTKEK